MNCPADNKQAKYHSFYGLCTEMKTKQPELRAEKTVHH